MARKGLLDVRIALADADELEPLSIKSRDVVILERRVKGVTLTSFLKDMSLVLVYHAAFIAMGREGRIAADMSLSQFEAAYDIDLRDPEDEIEGDESEETANPTNGDL